MDLKDPLKLAETKSLLWAEAQNSQNQGMDHTRLPVPAAILTIPGRWCFTDGSWKNQDIYSGQGWYSTLEGYDNGSKEYKSESVAPTLRDKGSYMGNGMHEEP